MPHRRGVENLLRVGLGLAVLGGCAPAVSAADESPAPFYLGDPGQAIIAILIFLLLLAVLGRWAWKPLVHQLRLRETKIADTIARSEKREREAQDLLAHYKARLDRAETESAALVDRSKKDAAVAREALLSEARREAHVAAETARKDIESAKREALRDLVDRTAELATDVAGRVLRKNLTEEDHCRILDESLREISLRAGEDE